MSKTFAPGRLDVAAFAQAKASLSAHDSIQKYERLAQELRAPEADLTIDWQADGEQRSAVDGSRRPALHLRAHWQMLRFAQALGDRHEVQGQLRHLAMAPLGHLVRRMPYGNNGRAISRPLQPMVPSAALRACIAQAMQACGGVAPENHGQKP